ncbi:MAG: MFS transporter [Acidobacteria bacterium]|nr:MFS transporter [Acidobacteriota bacterium]MBS1867124.1 MFS transporter [Acidobacteriota bacterium]
MATGSNAIALDEAGSSVSSSRFRALRHRNFQLFIGGQLVSLCGTWIQNTAQLWFIYRLTGSAALLGIFGFMNQIPMLLLSAFGGYVGDRYSRHRGVIATQAVSMILALLLAALTLTHRIQGRRGAWVVIFIGLLQGIVNAFDVPIRQSFFVNMVGKSDLPNAIALNSSIFNGARVIGPAIAGFAISLIGEGWCFFVNALSFLAVIVALLAMRVTPQEEMTGTKSAWQSLLQGFRFAMDDRVIRSVLILLSMLSFFGLQYMVFMPIFAKDVLHGGASTLGWLMSASGVGAVLGALQFAARTKYKGMLTWVGTMFLISSLGLILFSQSRWFWVSATVLFIFGFAATSQMAATNTTVQNRVPDELRSRVMAVYATMFMGVQPIGSLFAGGLAKRFGAPATVTAFGAICLLGSLIFFWRAIPWARSAKSAIPAKV